MDLNLTDFQLAHYKTFGFIQIKSVLNDNELKTINSEFESGLQAARKNSPKVEDGLPLQWSTLKPEFPVTSGLIEDPRICGVAEQLIGKDAIPVFSNGNRWVANTSWHPDSPNVELRCVKIACYLQSVRSDSGALRFIPGSHKAELNQEITDLLNDSNPDLNDVPSHICNSEPGDIIAFDNRLYHAAIGTSKDKRQLTMNFMQTPKTNTAQTESKNLANQIVEVYNLTKAPTPFYSPEWAANPSGNESRQRSVDWLKSMNLV
jgi:hypothetical protein